MKFVYRLMMLFLLLTLLIPSAVAVYETGIVETNGFTQVNLRGNYDDPVVVARPREGFTTSANNEVATAIITNVTSTSFLVELRNESVSLGGNVSYIVVETGSHIIEDGFLLQAGRETVDFYDANGESAAAYFTPTFGVAYSSAPSFFASPNNDSANDWVAVRYDGPTITTTGLTISLERDQAIGTAPIAASPTNSIAWIAINRTVGTQFEGGFEGGVDEDPGTGDFRTINFTNTYANPLYFPIGEQDGGTDPTTIGITNLSNDGVVVRHTEDRTDNEQAHATEDVVWAVFESGLLGQSRPSVPTRIECNSFSDCNFTVEEGVFINASGSFDVNSDEIFYFIEASLLNATSTESIDNSTNTFEGSFPENGIGESGSVTVANFTFELVPFSRTYSKAPIVIATPASQNGAVAEDDSALIPTINFINESHFNVTICQDNGAATCDLTVVDEIIHYHAFDQDAVADLDWIDVGTVDVTTAGADTLLTFNKTFTNVPVVWTTSQTYNQNGNIAAIAWVEDAATKTTSTAPLIGCVHQAIANACTGGQPSESMGYVAIDTSLQQIVNFQFGQADILNSLWTVDNFTPSFNNTIVMVTQNDDDGGEDPQYAWATNVTGDGFFYRYCEADAADVCHTHTGEVVNWFAHEAGTMFLNSSASVEQELGPVSYSNIFATDWKLITELNFSINITGYTGGASTTNANNQPDLLIQFFNGTEFVNITTLGATTEGQFNVNINDTSVLTAWETLENRRMQVTGLFFDGIDSSSFDQVNFSFLFFGFNGSLWNPIGNHSNTTRLFWNTTGIPNQSNIDLRARAYDVNGSMMFSAYFEAGHNLSIGEVPDIPLIAYTLTLPGQSPTIANDTQNATSADMTFTSQTNTAFGLSPCVGTSNTSCQNATTPFFVYTNVGTLNISLDIRLNASLGPLFNLTANSVFNATNASEVSTTPLVLIETLVVNDSLDTYFFGSAFNAKPSDNTSRLLTSTATNAST